MRSFISYLRTLLLKLADRLLQWNFSFKMNEAVLLHLDDVRLFRPTADAYTLLKLESVFDDWSVGQFPHELKSIP